MQIQSRFTTDSIQVHDRFNTDSIQIQYGAGRRDQSWEPGVGIQRSLRAGKGRGSSQAAPKQFHIENTVKTIMKKQAAKMKNSGLAGGTRAGSRAGWKRQGELPGSPEAIPHRERNKNERLRSRQPKYRNLGRLGAGTRAGIRAGN